MRPFFLLLLLMSCQVQQEADKSLKTTSTHIINGTKLSQKESDLARAGVALFYGNSTCSGILVSQNVILSAAHCFPSGNFDVSELKVFMGSQSPEFPKQKDKGQYAVEKVIIQPDYINSQMEADIAVIILKDAVSKNYEPVDIFDGDDYLAVAEPLVVAGFSPYSKALRNNVYELFTEKYRHEYESSNPKQGFFSKKIKNLLSRKAIMISDVLVGNNKVKDAIYLSQVSGGICSGDSGGPTMTLRGGKHYLVGINRATSAANKLRGNDCEFVSIATSVNYYRDWIDETIHKHNGVQPTWTLPGVQVNFRESKCSQILAEAFDIYYSLANPTPEFCKQLSLQDVPQELKNMNQHCEEVCGDLKGFEGQCSFLSRGNSNMIKLNKSLCPKGT